MIQTDELVPKQKTKIETQDTQDFKDEENLKIWNQWILENNTENMPLKFEL